MRALVLHGPGQYRVETNWPDPVPEPGWATVSVAWAGICGSDLPRFAQTGAHRHPLILGHEFTGTVASPAARSSRFKGGERVAALPLIPCGRCEGCRRGPFHCQQYRFLGSRDDGGFAQYCAVPEENLFLLPAHTDPRFGALVEPLSVALHAVRRSGFREGDEAVVVGAGTIGLLIGLWLQALGARRVAVADVRAESLAVARKLGLAETLLVGTPGAVAAGSYDYAFEAAGANDALLATLGLLRDQGTLTLVGRDTRDTRLPREDVEGFMRKELTLKGCWGYDLRGDEDRLRQALERFPLGPMITHEVPLDEAPTLIERLSGGHLFYCKILLRMTP